MTDPQPQSGVSPRVHERAGAVLAAAGVGSDGPELPGGSVLALVEAHDPGDPPRVVDAGAACGGGRRVLLTGEAVVLTDGPAPTHLLVRAVTDSGSGSLVLLERGDRGVDPWPREGVPTGRVRFESVRLDRGRVLAGRP